MPDLEQQRIAGVPLLPAVVVLGVAGVVGYLIFFKNSTKDPNAGTTGYSSQGLAVMQNPDESATMALQNQELSMLAQEFSTFGEAVSNVQTSVDANGAANSAYYNAVQGAMANYVNAVMAYISSQSSQIQAGQPGVAPSYSAALQQQAIAQALAAWAALTQGGTVAQQGAAAGTAATTTSGGT